MADNRIQMPQSGGGLLRYNDEYQSKFMLTPKAVVVMIVVFILIMIVLHSGLF